MSESVRRLPPLDLIKGFEAAARLSSVTLAAEELFLTQSAVSRQIKALEEHLGVALFHRRQRGLELTDAGRDYLDAVSQALKILRTATDELRRVVRVHRRDRDVRAGRRLDGDLLAPATELDDQAIDGEVARCIATLREYVGPPRHFAYPDGAHDDRVVERAARAGGAGALPVIPGRVTAASDRLRLPRYFVRSGVQLEDLLH